MKTVSSGVFLAHAADLALGAERLFIAALLCLEDADANLDDMTLVDDVDVQPVNLQALLEGVGTFATNLLKLADAYGHAQVRRCYRRGRSS
jgi:hypothetical protein